MSARKLDEGSHTWKPQGRTQIVSLVGDTASRGLWVEFLFDYVWRVEVRFLGDAGTPEIVEFKVSPREEGRTPPGGLTARALRGFSLRFAYQALAEMGATIDGAYEEGGEIASHEITQARPPKPGRPGRKPHGDDHYVRIASLYLERVERGSRTPIPEVAETMNLSEVHVRRQVAEARRRNLLTYPPPGRAGGRLTPYALALLNLPRDST